MMRIETDDVDARLRDTRAGEMKRFVEELQAEICDALEQVDGREQFKRDAWNRPEGGGGLTAVIEGGDVFEKGGVNTSAVYGPLPDRMAKALEVEPSPFFATGLSLVLHPVSPHVPTVHANFRYFALGEDWSAPDDQWFGGGADLTPYYPRLEDARHFHKTWKSVCEQHPEVASYEEFKQECDEYFYLPHREEARGVGGIFYDYLREKPEEGLAFSKTAGEAFLPSYLPIVARRKNDAYGEREREFQKIRRGRYVEFNLLFDRGTKFGIETGGRTESILMSLPPHVNWRYNFHPEEGSEEARAMWFFEPRDWLNLSPDDVQAAPSNSS